MTNNILSINIKLQHDYIRDSRPIKDKELLTLCYLFFRTDCKHNVCTTINYLCEKVNLSITNKNNKANNQLYIKEAIQSLIEKDIIELVNYEDIFTVANDKLIELHFKDYDSFVTKNQTHYVSLSLDEFETILTCDKNISNLLNLYCYIKSFVNMDSNNCVLLCYPSLKKMAKTFSCTKFDMIKPLLEKLKEKELLYIYHYKQNELTTDYSIEYVFALEEYTDKQIRHCFKIERI